MYIGIQDLITASAVLAAALALLGYYNRAYNWYRKQQRQEEDIAALKEEQGLLTYGVLAGLQGLKEQGGTGPGTDASEKTDRPVQHKADR